MNGQIEMPKCKHTMEPGEVRTAVIATVVPSCCFCEIEKLRAALIRAHCDLRWYEAVAGVGSIALSENASLGFTPEWEQAHVVIGASGPGSG